MLEGVNMSRFLLKKVKSLEKGNEIPFYRAYEAVEHIRRLEGDFVLGDEGESKGRK